MGRKFTERKTERKRKINKGNKRDRKQEKEEKVTQTDEDKTRERQ